MCLLCMFFFFKQKTAYEMRISDWSSDVCSSDLFAEAAMVGGLADWFAVTALFRHPMGLPIPHTAIVPRNKNRIADTLARFLLTNFLIPRLIARKMREVDIAGAVGKFLSQPAEGGGRLRLGASRIIADALGALDRSEEPTSRLNSSH